MKPTSSCPGPVSRRQFLRIGGLTFAGWGIDRVLPWNLRASAKAASPSKSDTSVIFIWLPGGPPHMETYDMKPDAPAEYRGEFKPIRTNVPGIEVCEHLPLHAKIADKFAIIRSIAHTFSDHGGGHKKFLTGRDPLQPVGFVNDYPMVGSMVAQLRQDQVAGVPNYICGVDRGRQGIDTFSFGSAYLGPATHPFMIVGDPSEPNFQVQNLSLPAGVQDRLPDRLDLLAQFDHPPAQDNDGRMQALAQHRSRAVQLITSDTARKAFDLSQESRKTREKYGMHRYGQRALIARRLVEAGASFVTMVMENPTPPGGTMPKEVCYNWDSHAVNCHLFEDFKFRAPYYDRAIWALISDLYDRGLDQKTMVIVTGEFGRTPRINYAKGTHTGVQQPGRDHWPQAMSVLVSGGGFRMGQIIGSTTAKGETPKDRPMTPNDLWATMFRHLGIDYRNTHFLDQTGRPMPMLTDGTPIAELC